MPYRVVWKGVEIFVDTASDLDALLDKLGLSPQAATVLSPRPAGSVDDSQELLAFLRAVRKHPKGIASSRLAALLGYSAARRISGRWTIWSRILEDAGVQMKDAVVNYRAGTERALAPGNRIEAAIEALSKEES